MSMYCVWCSYATPGGSSSLQQAPSEYAGSHGQDSGRRRQDAADANAQAAARQCWTWPWGSSQSLCWHPVYEPRPCIRARAWIPHTVNTTTAASPRWLDWLPDCSAPRHSLQGHWPGPAAGKVGGTRMLSVGCAPLTCLPCA